MACSGDNWTAPGLWNSSKVDLIVLCKSQSPQRKSNLPPMSYSPEMTQTSEMIPITHLVNPRMIPQGIKEWQLNMGLWIAQ